MGQSVRHSPLPLMTSIQQNANLDGVFISIIHINSLSAPHTDNPHKQAAINQCKVIVVLLASGCYYFRVNIQTFHNTRGKSIRTAGWEQKGS